jgi:hypothetical protein
MRRGEKRLYKNIKILFTSLTAEGISLLKL